MTDQHDHIDETDDTEGQAFKRGIQDADVDEDDTGGHAFRRG